MFKDLLVGLVLGYVMLQFFIGMMVWVHLWKVLPKSKRDYTRLDFLKYIGAFILLPMVPIVGWTLFKLWDLFEFVFCDSYYKVYHKGTPLYEWLNEKP